MFIGSVYALKNLLRRIVPPGFIPSYHRLLATTAAWWYGMPSSRMIVIGVTGTKGKTTTVHLLADILRASGAKVGFTTGVMFRIGEQTWPNVMKMTMPGRFALQRMLRRMADAGCRYAIIETTSEGISQSRHIGIRYDTVVMTNMSPEHIESHGSYAAYRAAKGRLFATLLTRPPKHIADQDIPTVKVLNVDDEEYTFFGQYHADYMYTYGLTTTASQDTTYHLRATDVELTPTGSSFSVQGHPITLSVIGRPNVMNALAALTAARALGISWEYITTALASARLPEGRFEEVPTNKNFKVFVDYAHEPASLAAAYETVKLLHPRRLIAVLGSQGGGRDRAKRPELGHIAATHADLVIVTNEDPYDESPEQIIRDVADGARRSPRRLVEGESLLLVVDREAAIREAIRRAGDGDIIMITGKGGERVMAVAGGRLLPWDDREIVKKVLVEKM